MAGTSRIPYCVPAAEWEEVCQSTMLCDSINDAPLEGYTFDPIV